MVFSWRTVVFKVARLHVQSRRNPYTGVSSAALVPQGSLMCTGDTAHTTGCLATYTLHVVRLPRAGAMHEARLCTPW